MFRDKYQTHIWSWIYWLVMMMMIFPYHRFSTVYARLEDGTFVNNTITVTNKNSWCINSFHPHLPMLPLNRSSYFHFTQRPTTMLSIVNVGSGTTGTSLIFQIFCAGFHLISAHWSDRCLPSLALHSTNLPPTLRIHQNNSIDSLVELIQSNYFSWFKIMDTCIVQNSHETQCTSQAMLALIKQSLLWAADHMHTLSDYPYSNFLPELLALSPDMMVIQTMREPEYWARSRLKHHNPKICHIDLHRSPMTRHPFDLIGCLHQTTYVHEAILNRDKFVEKCNGSVMQARVIFADAFSQLNRYNALIVRSHSLQQQQQVRGNTDKKQLVRQIVNLCPTDLANEQASTEALISLIRPLVAASPCVHQHTCSYDPSRTNQDIFYHTFCVSNTSSFVGQLPLFTERSVRSKVQDRLKISVCRNMSKIYVDKHI